MEPDPGSASFGSVAFQMPSLFWLKKAAPVSPNVQQFVCLSLCLLYIVYATPTCDKSVATLLCGSFSFFCGMWVTLWAISTHGPTTGAENLDTGGPLPELCLYHLPFASATIMIKPWQILLSCFSFVDSESNQNLQLNLCSLWLRLRLWLSMWLSVQIFQRRSKETASWKKSQIDLEKLFKYGQSQKIFVSKKM